MAHNCCFWFFSEDAVAVFAGGHLSIQRGLVFLKLEADLLLMGNPCLQMSGSATVPLDKVRHAVVIP